MNKIIYLLKWSRILSSCIVSGKFPTQRCRVSRTIVPQVLHGGDFPFGGPSAHTEVKFSKENTDHTYRGFTRRENGFGKIYFRLLHAPKHKYP